MLLCYKALLLSQFLVDSPELLIALLGPLVHQFQFMVGCLQFFVVLFQFLLHHAHLLALAIDVEKDDGNDEHQNGNGNGPIE